MPIDFTGIPTTRGRGFKTHNLNRINEGLKEILPIDQRAAILGSIIEESGGNPNIKNATGAYQGLLQWGADRYVPKSTDNDIELNNQVQYILDTVNNPNDQVSWTHGGKGSGYSSKQETYNTFHDKDAPFDKKFRAFSYGYVRPKGKEDSYNNRLKVSKKVLNKLVVDEVLSRPKPDKIPRYDFDSYQFKPKKRFDDGGYLDENTWDNLSMRDKAEMMKVAIANGITTLPDIRQAYNEFAKGGKMNSYSPSESIKRRITNWEGSSMKTNRSFAAEANDFNRVIPAEIRSKLSSQQLDALYSYGYNVGMGKLKERVLPTLTAYTQGKATREDVQKSMWASKDNQLRGLTTRRNTERELFGGNFRTKFTGDGSLGIHIDLGQYLPPQDYYNDISNEINGIVIPQLQTTDTTDIDPATMYKPPVIDMSLFDSPKSVTTEPVYNSKQERLDNLKKLNSIMSLFEQDTSFTGLVDNNMPTLLDYVGQIYS